VAQPEGGDIQGEEAIGLAFVGGGQSGGDHTVQGHVGQRRATRGRPRGQQPTGVAGKSPQQALRGENLQVALHAVGAGEFAVRLDFPDRRRDPLPFAMREDEVENLTLARRQGTGHSVQMNTHPDGRNPSLVWNVTVFINVLWVGIYP